VQKIGSEELLFLEWIHIRKNCLQLLVASPPEHITHCGLRPGLLLDLILGVSAGLLTRTQNHSENG